MDSPLSPIITNIVLMDLEERVLSGLLVKPLFYYRYVDDIVLAIPGGNIESTLETFNLCVFFSIHDRIKFTCEREFDRQISFLDVRLIVKGENIITNNKWYHKPIFLGRYLNFFSNHPIAYKKGVLMGLIDRSLLLSHPRFHQENFNFLIDTLVNNSSSSLHFSQYETKVGILQ